MTKAMLTRQGTTPAGQSVFQPRQANSNTNATWMEEIVTLLLLSLIKDNSGVSGQYRSPYPLKVSKERSLLLGLGRGGRMFSVTGSTALLGDPSSWRVKVNMISFSAYTLGHRQVHYTCCCCRYDTEAILTELISLSVSMEPLIRERMLFTTPRLDKKQ